MSPYKHFAIVIATLFLLLSTGYSRTLMQSTATADSLASPPSIFQESGGKWREMIELDYVDPGANTNKRSGLVVPNPDPETPAPQP